MRARQKTIVETLHLKYFYIFYAEWSHQPCCGLMFAAFRGGGRRFGPPLNTPLENDLQCTVVIISLIEIRLNNVSAVDD